MIRLFGIFAVIVLFFAVENAFAAQPNQHLAVKFDIDKARLIGQATITVPINKQATIYFGDLSLESLLINEKPLSMANEIDKLFLPAISDGYSISVSYHKDIDAASGGGLIDKNGIALFGFWHPTASVDMIYNLTAIVPDNFSAISESEEIKVESKNGQKEISFSFPYPVQSINFVAGPYVVNKEPFGNDQFLYTYFFEEDKDLADHYRQKAQQYLERYIKIIGPYPYRRFSIVENRLPTGYAMPTFTLLGQAVVRLPFIVDTSLGHEIVHAWFGNSVHTSSLSGNWSEGLTTYLADHLYAADRGEGAAYRKGQMVRYQSFVRDDNSHSLQEFYGADSHMAPGGKVGRAIGYDKSSMVFHMLRTQLGDQTFFEGLRDFYRRMRYKNAGWEDLQTSFEKVSNSSLKEFFEQWTQRSDIPVITIGNLRLQQENGLPVVTFEVSQKNEDHYHLTVPITFHTSKGEIKKVIHSDSLTQEVAIPLDEIPVTMVVDPEYDVMRKLSKAELPPVWSRFVGAAKKIAVLSKNSTDESWSPLIGYLQQIDCQIKDEDDVSDADIADAAVLFLGTDSSLAMSLFAKVEHPATGFVIDGRQHPLNEGLVAFLISAENKEEVKKAARKLRHYGKYSYLHFKKGRAVQKGIKEMTAGQYFRVDDPPKGMAVGGTDGFDAIISQLADNRVIYVGESHTSQEDHQLQLRIIRAMYEIDSRLAIGMEMFSFVSQQVLDDYIAGAIDEKTFLKKANYFKQWGYDYRHYRDILLYARRHKIPVIGLNLEKGLVSKVFKEGGISSLEEEEQAVLPPDRDLDIEGYQDRIASVFKMHGRHQIGGGQFKDFFQSQALWDETMASVAAEYLVDNPDSRMIVLAGRGHVVKDSGIPPRLFRRVQVKQAVVVNAGRDDVHPELIDYVFFSQPVMLPAAPLLGVSLVEKEGSVKIIGVLDKGAAKKAGVLKDDIILSLNGVQIKSVADLKIEMMGMKKGDEVILQVERQGGLFGEKEIDIAITL